MDANKRLKDSHNANKFSSYKILSKLGHGAYGTVYKAQHITTMEVLAIKAVQVEEDEFIEDYMTEINLVQNLSHKNIVKCYGFEKRVSREESNNNAFRRRMKSQRCELLIFLEYCANGSLKDMMCDETIFPGKFIPENLAKGYIKQTLEGLKYLHEQGVIHRDIKCANLLVSSPENTIKLADFGISTQITNTLKSGVRNGNEGVAMTCIGSPNWMAPEILLGQGATSKSDIWSLGSTLVEMLTGKPPFYNLSNREAVCYAIVHDYFIFTKKDRERLSSSSLLFVDYLFNKNIFERPSAKDLLEKKFIDSTKNSSWLFEEEDDVQFKNDKLKKFREADNDNQLTMFDDDFIAVENMNGNPKDKYDTGMSMAIQDSPFKPKPKTHKEINSHSLREAFVSLARTDFIIEKMETEKLNSFEFLKIIEELNNDDLTRLILNKLIIFKKGQVLDYNLMTLFKILFGKIDKLGLEMTSKINALLESFLKLNGSDCLVLYWSQILDDPTLDNLKALKMWIYLCFLNNGLDRLSFSPLIINFLQKVVMGFEEFDMIIWKLVLKISFYVINKYGDYYISIFNPLIDYLVKIESFDSENDFEMFKIFFLKITEINARMTTSQIKKLVTTKVTQNEKMWNYFLVKVMNNILRNSNEKKTTIDLENDLKVKSIENKSIFILNKFFKKWMFEDICDQLLLLNFDDILDFKFCRYVFELIYNMFTFQSSTKLMFIDKTFLLITCEKLSLLKLDPKIFDSNTLKYHRYDLKLIIKLIADLSIEFDNKSLDLSLRVYEYYAYVSLLYLQRHITYSTYAIDTLSNCCHVLLDAKIMTFPNVKTMQLSVDGKNILNTDLRLFLNGFIEMNLIKNFTSEDKKNEDYKTNSFDLVFKSIHRLLSSMTISVNTKIEENVDVTRDDMELEFSQQYSPLSLFIVDHPNFFDIVQTILDKYQGSLILQIDFLKFLKLVFKQYVGFKINYYMNKENMIQKDDMNKKMNSYNNLKQDANIGDMFPKRTQNFKLVRDYLLSLWEQSPKKANIDNMSAISSVHSSPKKLLSNQEKGFIFTHINENTKTQGRVGHNSIIIKTLLRDIDLIYKQSITLA